MHARVCAAIVTFNPSADLVENVEALAPQVEHMVIVDNGSGSLCLPFVLAAAKAGNAELIRNIENQGVASALNTAGRWAQPRGFTWLATFDQDSLPTRGMIDLLLDAARSAAPGKPVAVVAPRYDEAENPAAVFAENDWYEAPVVITSGSLVRLSIWDEIGGFEDRLFIDCVDHEYCLRARAQGNRVIVAPKALLLHKVGAPSESSLLGVAVVPSNHSAARRYYHTRNRLLLWRRYWSREPAWVAGDMNRFVRDVVKIALLEEARAEKLTAICRGVLHAIKGRFGKIPSQRAGA